jgi:hypothetical protein
MKYFLADRKLAAAPGYKISEIRKQKQIDLHDEN